MIITYLYKAWISFCIYIYLKVLKSILWKLQKDAGRPFSTFFDILTQGLTEERSLTIESRLFGPERFWSSMEPGQADLPSFSQTWHLRQSQQDGKRFRRSATRHQQSLADDQWQGRMIFAVSHNFNCRMENAYSFKLRNQRIFFIHLEQVLQIRFITNQSLHRSIFLLGARVPILFVSPCCSQSNSEPIQLIDLVLI